MEKDELEDLANEWCELFLKPFVKQISYDFNKELAIGIEIMTSQEVKP